MHLLCVVSIDALLQVAYSMCSWYTSQTIDCTLNA